MAADTGEKTEPPTARRRLETRQKGQVARSQDLGAAALLLAAFISLKFLGVRFFERLQAIMQAALGPSDGLQEHEVVPFAASVAVEAGKLLAPFLVIIFVATVAVQYAQVGGLLTLQPLIPSLSKINPLNGIKRIFSLRSVVAAMINFAKLLVVGMVAYWTLSGAAAEMLFSAALGLPELLVLAGGLTFRLAMRLAVALLILAILDYAYQRYQHERDMKMTKEEVKDELRSMEGDPQIKRRRRQVQLQMAMQQLSSEVPQADVVVTNPTHLAIALRYDTDTMHAPKVVAKGADQIALRIRQIASEHGIPIVERKPLARAMYYVVEVGEYIPERFYQAIAEILAYVYELSSGRRPGEPRASARAAVGVS